MTLKILLTTQMTWVIFIKPVKNTAQIKKKILIVFDDMVVYMISYKKPNPIVTELSIWGRELNISYVFITQSFLAVPKNIRLNSTHYFIIKSPNKWELKQFVFNHSSDIDFQNFMNLYNKFTTQLHFFLIIDATLASDNPPCFRKNLLERK